MRRGKTETRRGGGMATAMGGRGDSGEACYQHPELKLEVVSGTVVHIIAEQLAIELGHAHGDPRYRHEPFIL